MAATEKPVLSRYRDRMDKSVLALKEEFSGLRTGRASAGLLDQVIDFLFSPSGGLLRRQLVDAMVERMDNLAWRMALRIGRRLPDRMLPPGLRERQSSPEALDPRPLLDLEPVRQLTVILRDLPGFEPRLLVNRLPRLLGQPDLRQMGADVARGLAERGVVRLLRDVLVTPA